MTIKPAKVILKDPFVEWHSYCDREHNFTVYSRGFTYYEDRLYEGKDLTALIACQCRGNIRESQHILEQLVPLFDV